jgi:predicted ABC-type ATPase
LVDFEAGRKAIELFQFAIKHHISFSMESTLSGYSILNFKSDEIGARKRVLCSAKLCDG